MRRPLSVYLAATIIALATLLSISVPASYPAAAQPAPQQPPAVDLDLQRQAIAVRAEAFRLRQQGDFEGAIVKYEEARDLYRRANDRAGEVNVVDVIAAQYELLGDYRRALAVREEALTLARAYGERLGEAEVLQGISQIYGQLGQYARAREIALQSVALARELSAAARGRNDLVATELAEFAEGAALGSLGFAHNGLGEYARALEVEFQRLALARGQVARAIAREEQAGLRAARLAEQRTFNAIGSNYGALGQYDRALEFFQQALNAAIENGDIDGALAYQSNVAFVHAEQGRLDEALTLFEEALEVVRTRRDRLRERALLNNIGALYERRGDDARALTLYEQSLAIARTLGDRTGEGISLNNLGIIHFRRRDLATARTAMEQALAIARETGYRALEQRALNNLARVVEEEGDLPGALAFSRAAVAVAEDVRTLARIEELQRDAAAQAAGIYARAVSLLLRAGLPAEAFDVAERGRARGFLDQIGSVRPAPRRGGGPLVQREQELRDEISELDRNLRRARAQPAAAGARGTAELDAELAAKQAEYADVLTRLRLADPESASLVSVSPLTLAQVQPLLDDQTTLLSYFLTPEGLLAFIVTRRGFHTVELEGDEAALRGAIDRFRAFEDLGNPDPAELRLLHARLVAPVQSLLSTPVVGIVPSGVLHYVPFAALRDEAGGYFGDRHALFQLPSASALPFIQAKRRAGAGPVLALAQAEAGGLPTLRWAGVEAQAVAGLSGARALAGGAATETAFRAEAGRSRVVHVAAHGELNAQSPLFSRIFLAPDGQNDGSLEVAEVYGLELAQTGLVVLSACETQLGAQSGGDEIVGLTRAFIYAGTPTVVASLWSVNDRATAIFMTAFYERLAEGMSKAEALVAAQTATRALYPHPFHWAAFVLTGDPGG